MKQLEFAGITLMSEPVFTFEDKFEVLRWEAAESVAVSKQMYNHEEEGLTFKYRYIIQITDMDEYDDVDENVIVELFLVPDISSLCDSLKADMARTNGVEVSDLNLCDVLEYGDAVRVGVKAWANHDISGDVFEDEDVAHSCLSIANVIDTMNSMRGFYLDKYVNRIGTTGWDMLDSAINGSDWVKETMKRWEEEK